MKTRTMSLLRKRSAKATVFVILCLLTGAASAEEWKSVPQEKWSAYPISYKEQGFSMGGPIGFIGALLRK